MSEQINSNSDGNALLARIVAAKLEECALLRQRAATLRIEAEALAFKTRGFRKAISGKSGGESGGELPAPLAAIICETKRASPSAGVISNSQNGSQNSSQNCLQNNSPAKFAASAELAAATCISVLTDARWFHAQLGDLESARNACSLPVLRKDFIIDNLQIYESRLLGADCVLLIMRLLEDAQAQELEQSALALGMDVLVEIHSEHELARALKHLRADMIGVNSRDLQSLEINLDRALKLVDLVPASRIAIAESGLRIPQDLLPFIKARANNTSNRNASNSNASNSNDKNRNLAFLIGEAIMRAKNPQQAIKDFCQVEAPQA